MDMRKLVGRNFARLRREKGPDARGVEARSGFSQQYLSGLERGKRNPSIVTLYEIAQALGVSHVELVTPTMELEIELSLCEAEHAIERVTGVCGGEPVFRGTRVRLDDCNHRGATAGRWLQVIRRSRSHGGACRDLDNGNPVSGRPPKILNFGATVTTQSVSRYRCHQAKPLKTGKFTSHRPQD